MTHGLLWNRRIGYVPLGLSHTIWPLQWNSPMRRTFSLCNWKVRLMTGYVSRTIAFSAKKPRKVQQLVYWAACQRHLNPVLFFIFCKFLQLFFCVSVYNAKLFSVTWVYVSEMRHWLFYQVASPWRPISFCSSGKGCCLTCCGLDPACASHIHTDRQGSPRML